MARTEAPHRVDRKDPMIAIEVPLKELSSYGLLLSTALSESLKARNYGGELILPDTKDRGRNATMRITERARSLANAISFRTPELQALDYAISGHSSVGMLQGIIGSQWSREFKDRVKALETKTILERLRKNPGGPGTPNAIRLYEESLKKLVDEGAQPLSKKEVAREINELVEREIPFYLWDATKAS